MDEQPTSPEGTGDDTPETGVPAVPARVATPVGERTHPVHWFTGRLGEVLDGLVGATGDAGLALMMLDETSDATPHQIAARLADDIADEQDTHRIGT